MFIFHWLVMTVKYLKDLKDIFVTVMEAREPVDLFILPGDIFNPAHNYLCCIVFMLSHFNLYYRACIWQMWKAFRP